MSDRPFIPSRDFPRDIHELSQWQWNPRIRFSRERVKIDTQRVMLPDVRLPLLDSDVGKEIDREA